MADAVEVAIEAALLARAQAFADAQGLTIAMPNVAFPGKNPDGSAKAMPATYLRATFLPADTESRRIGFNEPNRHFGLLQIDVIGGQDGGEIKLGRIASAAIAYFARGTRIERDGFTVQIDVQPYRRVIIKDDPWAMIPVRVPYQCLG